MRLASNDKPNSVSLLVLHGGGNGGDFINMKAVVIVGILSVVCFLSLGSIIPYVNLAVPNSSFVENLQVSGTTPEIHFVGLSGLLTILAAVVILLILVLCF